MEVFTFIQIVNEHSVSKEWRIDQTPRSAVSDLVLHCLPLSTKWTLGLKRLSLQL